MGEVFLVVGAASSFQALFSNLCKVVSAFRKAFKDVKTAPEKTIELSVEVDNVSRMLKSVEKIFDLSPEDAEELLTRHVEALGEQVRLALEKVEKDKQRKKNVKVVEVAKAVVGRGASKQNKSTKKIRDRIRELKEDLSQAVITLAVKLLLPTFPQDYQPTEHRLLSLLDSLDNHDRYHSCWEDVELMAASSGSNRFSPLKEIQDVGSSDNRRGARAGSAHEVLNSTRLRFSICYDAHENAYFYFIAYYKSDPNKPPQLFFPSDSKQDNKLERSQERMFPDRSDYSDDPFSFKLEREDRTDRTLTKDWVVWVYLILSNVPLHTASTPKIEELEQKLAEMNLDLLQKPEDDEFKDTQVEFFKEMEEEEEETSIAVKRYSFDIINKASE